MLVLEGIDGYGLKLRFRKIEEEIPVSKPKQQLIYPIAPEIYDPACKKRCTNALKECLTSCRI